MALPGPSSAFLPISAGTDSVLVPVESQCRALGRPLGGLHQTHLGALPDSRAIVPVITGTLLPHGLVSRQMDSSLVLSNNVHAEISSTKAVLNAS